MGVTDGGSDAEVVSNPKKTLPPGMHVMRFGFSELARNDPVALVVLIGIVVVGLIVLSI